MKVHYQAISFEVRDEGVAYIGMGASPTSKSMPVLDRQALEDLDQVMNHLTEGQGELRGVIFFSHKDRAFIAGADLSLIAQMKTESQAQEGAELGQQIFNKLEDLRVPTVCCVHGPCLGGGMEFALATDFIVASTGPQTVFRSSRGEVRYYPGLWGNL